MEQWKPVKGYEGQFLVSDLGRIMNDHGLILKTRRDARNNLIVTLKGKDIRVAYAVAHAFVHNPNGLPYQIYKDGDKGNCHADNIEWGMPGRDNNDGLSKAITLVKDGEVLEFQSISAAVRFLHTTYDIVKEAAYNTDRDIRVHGYFIAWADDEERINHFIDGAECVKSLEGEEWRGLPELKGEYQVSNLEWVTPEENKRRAQALGLLKKKSKAGDDPS